MMEFHQSYLDAAHPFSFITDERGEIQCSGRSLRKLCQGVVIGQLYDVFFEIKQPSLGMTSLAPEGLAGELVIAALRVDPSVQLRGQIVSLGAGQSFLFSLNPSITDAAQLAKMGLEFGDFVIGDPIFDFLLLLRMQKQAKQKAEEVNIKLEWEVRVSKLLHQITVDTYDLIAASSVYRIVINSICRVLEWQLGHVFFVEQGDGARIKSGRIWSIANEPRFHSFLDETERLEFREGEGLPGRVLKARSVIWVPNALCDPEFPRRASLAGVNQLTAVGIPIIVAGDVIAVLEFFSEGDVPSRENMVRFFEMLGLLVSGVLARQRAQRVEREQLAFLAHTSKMATLGEIAAGVAHEINNPLSTMSLITTIIRKLSEAGNLSSEALSTQLSRFESCVERIAKIVSELRAFSRDSQRDSFEVVNIRDLIEQTLDLCHARFMSHGVELIVKEIPVELQAECRGSQISQVLLNLVNNAYDAVSSSAERWVAIEVLESGGEIEISVSDSGPGIPPEIRQRIMSPFFTTKPPGKGTGLGLSISSNIMSDHGGKLFFDESAPHTRFVMRLPKRQALESKAAS